MTAPVDDDDELLDEDEEDEDEDEDSEELDEEGEASDDAEAKSGEDSRDRGPRRKRARRRNGGNVPSIEPPDEQSKKVFDFVKEVVLQMGVNCTVHLRRPKDEDQRDIRLEVVGPDAARVIGKRGQVLGALQFLANRILSRPGEERRFITVDAEGYRSRRDNSLAAMAKRLGKQAVTDGKIITFEPMPPRDRRLVHLALAKFEGVVTRSEGEGDDRRVQIIPVRRT
ncbi:MAG TPA: R3H domain-containing nucleic acid-binding protein [Polyangiaceae bacterium]|jgi:spoIIIJ-associated protein|nr:R3H domain-containing nucleic acid-binding protein [Polyangiaceae bacterium]